MAVPGPEYRIQWHEQISDIPQSAWDAMALPLKTPFFEWEWLHNLEASGSVGPKTGWQPLHLSVWRGVDLLAVAPLYLKGHSYGEFVFDQQWAELADRLGLTYYPKLVGMSPFTPAIGYRFLTAPGEDAVELTRVMVAAIDQFCRRNRILGCNLLYVDPDWRPVIEAAGFTPWMHQNSVWQNVNFKTYDDYLAMFNANQRRNIKREMKAVEAAGITLNAYSGDEIPENYIHYMHDFYSNHCSKFGWWGSKYLTQDCFENFDRFFRHRILLIAAEQAERSHPVAMSFCVHKGENLYGRYWGCFEEFDALHFNACYYKPIEWAIQQGIQVFDPGAGGAHKKRRGFPATPHHSMHRFYDGNFGNILKNYLSQVNDLMVDEIEAINNELPFKAREISLDPTS
jgi:uncharacterized protein